MTDQFICAVCGETHEGLPTDRAYKLPDVVWSIPESRRAERARFNEDLCQYGERYFIRCVLEIPFVGSSKRFGWGAWAEVDHKTFDHYLTIYDKDGSTDVVCFGTLANKLSVYENPLDTPVTIQFSGPTQRPNLFLMTDDDSRLAFDQRNGLDNARYHEILAVISGR